MSEVGTNLQNGGYSAVPLEPPPAYEPKPDDVDVEQDANSRREGRAARMMAFFSRYKPYWQKPALYFVLAVISLWFTVVILNAFGVRRSGILYSNSCVSLHDILIVAS